jgi:two-component system nitrogen regulation response regulator NtrX
MAATNKDLQAAVKRGEFREDLFFRLNVVPVHVPPLRERRDDIPLLVEHFLELYCLREERPPVDIAPEAIALLQRHEWPGNVRELRNTLERMAILSDTGRISPEDVPFTAGPAAALRADAPTFLDAPTYEQFKDLAEREYLERQLARNEWNVAQTAKVLQMPRSNLYKKIEKHGLTRDGAGE